jgi:hypothetical protein
LKPVGYGYDSIEAAVATVAQLRALGDGADANRSRQSALAAIDEQGLLATPQNSFINELVIEAARRSIQAEGSSVRIRYSGQPAIE